MGKQQIDVNEFKRVTSNLTTFYTSGQVILFYVYRPIHKGRDESFEYNNRKLANEILNLQNVEVVFNCLAAYRPAIGHLDFMDPYLCKTMDEGLPASNVINSPEVLFSDQREYQWYQKYVLRILKNPKHTQNTAFKCTHQRFSVIFWLHHSITTPPYLSLNHLTKASKIKATITVQEVRPIDGFEKPYMVKHMNEVEGVIVDKQSIGLQLDEYLSHFMIENFVSVIVVPKKSFNNVDTFQQYSKGKSIFYIIITDDNTSSSVSDGKNKILTSMEEFYDPVVINMLIEQLNQLIC